MPNTSLDQAQIALKRMMKSGFGLRPDGSPLTASIGVAEQFHDQAESPQHLLALADQRMYQAKQAGRNQICATSSF